QLVCQMSQAFGISSEVSGAGDEDGTRHPTHTQAGVSERLFRLVGSAHEGSSQLPLGRFLCKGSRTRRQQGVTQFVQSHHASGGLYFLHDLVTQGCHGPVTHPALALSGHDLAETSARDL